MQYVTVVGKLPRLQQNYSFQKWNDSHEKVFVKRASLNIATQCTSVWFLDNSHSFNRDSTVTKKVFLQYHMIQSFSVKKGIFHFCVNHAAPIFKEGDGITWCWTFSISYVLQNVTVKSVPSTDRMPRCNTSIWYRIFSACFTSIMMRCINLAIVKGFNYRDTPGNEC